MIKVITIGSACQDIFFPTTEGVLIETPEDVLSQKKLAFELGAKYAITERFETLGGNSLNVAVGLSKLGIDVAAYSTVGDDSVGKWILRELKKTTVKTNSIKVENDCNSDLSSIIVDQQSNDRIIFSSHVANKKLAFDESRIESSHWFFLGDLSGNWQSITDDFLHFARRKNVKISFNPRQSTIHEDVKKVIETIYSCDILFVNKDEAIEIVTGFHADILQELLDQEEFLLKELHAMGAKIIALTDGIRGAWAYDGRSVFHENAVLQKAVDSTGAGDAFTSGFFAAHLNGKNIQACLKWGVANSSSSVTKYGGQAGLLSDNEIENKL